MSQRTNTLLRSANLPKAKPHPKNAIPLAATDFSEADLKRFWSKVNKNGPDECWEWIGAKNKKGYGRIIIKGKVIKAPRIVLALNMGFTGSFHALHQCDNGGCCNPAHIFPGTIQDNVDDMMTKGRQRKTFGEKHPRAMLKEQEAMDIKSRRLSGESRASLAKEYGVSVNVVYFISSGKTWKHLS